MSSPQSSSRPSKGSRPTGRKKTRKPRLLFTRLIRRITSRFTSRQIISFVLAAALVTVLISAVIWRQVREVYRYNQCYNQAVKACDVGNYEEALMLLRRASTVRATDDVTLLMADCYAAMGNYEKSLELLRRLDHSNAEIRRKIDQMEQSRSEKINAEKVRLAGQEFEIELSALALPGAGLNNADLKELVRLYALTSLTLSDNALSDISALSSLGGLTHLNLSGNQIADIGPLSALVSLRSLTLDGNPVQDLSPLCSLSMLTTLSIRGMTVSPEQLQLLTTSLPGCAILSDNPDGSGAQISLGGQSFADSVTQLDLSDHDLSDISALSACRSLTKLDLSGNSISDLSPLMDIPGLQELIIDGNNVSNLRPLMALHSLQVIRAEHNAIGSTVPLSGLTQLSSLYLSYNPVTDYSGLEKLTSLQTLELRGTGLSNADLSVLSHIHSLNYLDIQENAGIGTDAYNSLNIALSHCEIVHSELVTMLELGGSMFPQDSTSIEITNASEVNLASIYLFNRLETLKIRGASLKNIYPLQNMSTLRHLDLACNKIEDITPVASLYDLETLDLSSNYFSMVTPFFSLTNLTELNLSGNPIPPDQLDRLRNALPNCKIIYD